jgi:hypothetical protein
LTAVTREVTRSPADERRAPRIEPSAAAIGLLFVLAANARYLDRAGAGPRPDGRHGRRSTSRWRGGRVAEIVRTDPFLGPLYALWLKPSSSRSAIHSGSISQTPRALGLPSSMAIYWLPARSHPPCRRGCRGSLCFLISVWNVPLDSKVSGFALLVVVGGLAVAEALPAARAG